MDAAKNAIMDMYRSLVKTPNSTFDDARNRFAKTKIDQPLVGSYQIDGKTPVPSHILENEYHERSVEDIISLLISS
ncbi:hypothetical protein K7I13_05485 [Brucepastera parasyntrophica]|uniref:hypothetical protein n=1 Tax=Brucepastera parasyntrophica TaxID=2880008 RepID=UPI00210AE307|nr:hypothetical protein [Brucepastera parasyntrophica]ULQ60723.1 hypothetical protein K7I13_05485 [Brucepastera parasyntrophica]